MKKLTIQQKIILWFAAMFLIIVVLVSGLTFAIASQVLNENIQERLMNTVTANLEEVEFIPDLDDTEREPGDVFLDYKNGWLEIDDDFSNFLNGISIALYDQTGDLLYGEAPIRIPKDKNLTFTKVGTMDYKGEKFYIYERPLTAAPELEGLWMRGVISESENTHILYTVVRLTFWFIPLLGIIALLGGYIITRRSFLPVEQIARAAEEIGRGNDLSKRLDIGPGEDEIHMLASTFNDMFDRLEQRFETERQFTSDVSHELRTPTSVILAQAEYALELADTEEEYREALEVIKRQGGRMSDMISQLLFFTRLDQGTEPMHLERLDLSRLLTDICQEQQLLKTNDIALTAEISPEIFGTADRNLLIRAVNNLIGNAYKYGKPGGHIQVSLKVADGRPVIAVRDDGPGIAPDHLARIWDRFYQVDEARSESGEDRGLGLGLSMVKQIASLLGADLAVDSRLGEGTAFTLHLPEA